MISALWSLWTSLWYFCCVVDYIILVNAHTFLQVSLGLIRDTFLSLINFIERNVSVDFFIYYVFLPIAFIPFLIVGLINHAGRYTLPYSKCGRPKKRRKSGRRGLHLARYYASLRQRSSTRVFPRTSTFNKGRTTELTQIKSTDSPSFGPPTATVQVNRLLSNDPSLALDLFLFESKLYWDDQPILLSSWLPTSQEISSFLRSFDVLHHYRSIQLLSPSSSSSSEYTSISSASSQFRRILLEARGLQSSIQRYGESIPLSSPSIYVSSNKDDLPIVIDTGASCTIT